MITIEAEYREVKRESLEDEVKLIRDDGLKLLVILTLSAVPEYFFTMPASTSGKYHPSYALGEGGLIRHTKAAVNIAEDLLKLEQNASLSEAHHDNIIAALILHDSVKKGMEGSAWTTNEHPKDAAKLFKDTYESNKMFVNVRPHTVETVSKMIASHMGQWDCEGLLSKPETEGEKFVHLCDYLASRKWLEYTKGI